MFESPLNRAVDKTAKVKATKLTFLLRPFLFEAADNADKVAFFAFSVLYMVLESIDLGGRRGLGICKCGDLIL